MFLVGPCNKAFEPETEIMATYTVTTNSDTVDANDGETSLREALTLADGNAGADKIVFDKALAGSTIELQGELVLSSEVTINGDTNKDGDADITISGGGTTRLVTVQAGVTAALTSLNLTEGNEFSGADVIENNGTLTLSYSVISGNGSTTPFQTGSYNPTGTILNAGQLEIIQTAFSGNIAVGGTGNDGLGSSGDGEHAAGAVLNLYGATLTLDQVAISGGTAIGGNAGSAGGSYGGWAALGVLNLGTMSGTADNDSTGGTVTAGTGNSSSFNGQSSLTNLNYSGSFINGTGAITQVALGTQFSDFASGVLGGESFNGLAGADTITGNDYSSILGGTGNDSLTGGRGVTASGGLGNDMLVCTFATLNSFSGGEGRDTIDFSQDNFNGQIIDLSTASFGFFNSTFSGFENVIGSQGDDNIIGSGAANTINGFSGDDTISGGARGDVLNGGAGDGDTLSYEGSDAKVSVNILTGIATGGHAQGDTISLFENITGSGFADRLTGGAVANTLIGGRGNDVLKGGGGDDRLSGSADADRLSGGAGADVFVLPDKSASADTVIDFFSSLDSIEISAASFGAGLQTGALAGARFRVNGTGQAGDGNDRFILNIITGELFFDSDGSAAGGARLIATFAGGTGPTASDFEIV